MSSPIRSRSPRALLLAAGAALACLGATAPAQAAPGFTRLADAAPAAPSPGTLKPQIVNGTPLADTTTAPYSVGLVINLSSESAEGCSGTVLDPVHILTAAHCIVQENGTPVPPTAIQVFAGTSNVFGTGDPNTQAVGVAKARPHPRYVAGQFDDDVAVLTLATPLNFATGRVAPLALPPVGTKILPRTKYAFTSRSLRVTGFGITSTNGSDFGQLNAVDLNAVPVGLCQTRGAGADAPAILVCSNQEGKGACQGDSGGTATVGPVGRRVLAGVTDTSGSTCEQGINLYANVAAPEIRSFIDAAVAEQDLTAAQTPLSPRGGRSVKLTGTGKVGRTVRCRRGSWAKGSKFRYAFVFVKGNKERNRGLRSKTSYKLRSSDRGWSVTCAVEARNAGGTGVAIYGFVRRVAR